MTPECSSFSGSGKSNQEGDLSEQQPVLSEKEPRIDASEGLENGALHAVGGSSSASDAKTEAGQRPRYVVNVLVVLVLIAQLVTFRVTQCDPHRVPEARFQQCQASLHERTVISDNLLHRLAHATNERDTTARERDTTTRELEECRATRHLLGEGIDIFLSPLNTSNYAGLKEYESTFDETVARFGYEAVSDTMERHSQIVGVVHKHVKAWKEIHDDYSSLMHEIRKRDWRCRDSNCQGDIDTLAEDLHRKIPRYC
ncbi:hypothetical protein MMC28_000595 [Mycoblastus sanguinarius]|nr:hypothetical protein [Mycoblastus sanguinarius]